MNLKGIQLGRRGHNKELNELLKRIEMNMANNYKDNAQENYRAFCKAVEELKGSGKLKGKQLAFYEEKQQDYEVRLKDFTHKDQKPYWT